MRTKAIRMVVLAIATVVCLAACTGAATPTLAPTDAPTSTAPPSIPESPPAATTGPGSAGVQMLCAREFEACQLTAGTYTSQDFTPNFQFTIDTDWLNDRDWPHGGGISNLQGGLFWAVDVASGFRNGEEVAFDPTPAAFIEHLRLYDGLAVDDPVPAEVDGVEGTAIDVATRTLDAPGVYFVVEDSFNLVPGEKARFILLELDGRFVIVVIDAFQEGSFDAVVQAVEAVLETWHWL